MSKQIFAVVSGKYESDGTENIKYISEVMELEEAILECASHQTNGWWARIECDGYEIQAVKLP